jgi:Trm5-related predicted tRNA methylase
LRQARAPISPRRRWWGNRNHTRRIKFRGTRVGIPARVLFAALTNARLHTSGREQ